MIDLFGHERPEPAGNAAPAVQLGLVEHAAERAALRSGRPVSQERAEIASPVPTVTIDATGTKGGDGPYVFRDPLNPR